MPSARYLILFLFAAIVATPLIAQKFLGTRGSAAVEGAADPNTPTLIIVTPHVEQIREEFGRAFSDWHKRHHGTPVRIDWRAPGGTTEIRKQLEAQVTAAVQSGKCTIVEPTKLADRGREKDPLPEAVIDSKGAELPDLFLGGGSFEHGQAKSGIELDITRDGKPLHVRARISAQPQLSGKPLPQADLDALYGENKIGIERLYDPDQFWFGTALSAFGIVYNRDLLAARGHKEPESFEDLGHPIYFGLVAMADPRQSGSVATLYDSILNKEGWVKGWRILREMSANARAFVSSSTQPPQDVAQGDCLAGVAIDFYGRGQAQSILRPGEAPGSGRVGYIDPPGGVYIDADPVSIINGARNPELAARFVQFCLTDEAQALWQFSPTKLSSGTPAAVNAPLIDPAHPDWGPMGPREYRLRRLPVRRQMYDRYLAFFTDKTNPFSIASQHKVQGWRDAIGPLMGAFAIDTAPDLRAAWKALQHAKGHSTFPQARLEEMETLFYALPNHTMKDGTVLPFNEANYKAISADTNKWRDPQRGARAKIAYTEFFKNNYRKVVELGRID